jgi:heme exporter protein C
MIKGIWWKILAVALVFYTLIAGYLIEVPRLPILNETIRNLFFHVTMWFAMMIMLLVSLIFSLAYLFRSQKQVNSKNSDTETITTGDERTFFYDWMAKSTAQVGLLFGLVGIATGAIWARFTWGDYWVFEDPKLNGAALGVLVYLAYLVLRGAIPDQDKQARIGAVFNIFAFVMYMVFVNVLPRISDSLHPGNGGNPGLAAMILTAA